MKHSETIAALVEALAKSQSEFAPVQKNKTAKVKTKAGYEYTYQYADLADILQMALPVLSKNGIAFSQPHILIDGKLRVVTYLLHKSGEWMHSDGIEISEDGDPQQFGAESTYFRRYDGASFIGVAPDEDTDAQQAGKRTGRTTPAQAVASQGAQPSTQAPTNAPAASQVAPGYTKRIGTDGLIATIKKLEMVPAKEKTGTTKAVNAWLKVHFLSPYQGCTFASCFDDKFWACLGESVGQQCEFQIVEKEYNDHTYLNIVDVRMIAGEEFVNGKPILPEGEKQ